MQIGKLPYQWLAGVWVCVLSSFSSRCQPIDDTLLLTARPVTTWAAGLHYGSIFAHSEAVQNTAGSHPYGIELQYTRQRTDRGAYDLCRCYPRQGVAVSYFNYDNNVLGQGAMAGWLLEPVYRLGPKWQLSLRGIVGLAYLTNPYDAQKNPTNMSYSTAISAWLAYGMGLSYPLGTQWRLHAYGNFQHVSNGGLKQPNKGINWPTAALMATYAPQPATYFTGSRSRQRTWIGQPWRKDITLYGVAKRVTNANGTGTRVPVGGMQLLGSKQVGRINALTGAAEITLEGKLYDSLTTGATRAGLLAGHEFLLGRFIFSQQLAVYMYNSRPPQDWWYHRWGLNYRFSKRGWVGFNLKAHKHVADFLDLRLVYSW